MDYLTQDVLWYQDLENVYITPDIQINDPTEINVEYENNDHSKIVITCLNKYRLSLNLKNTIKGIKNIVGKQIVLEKDKKEAWTVLTTDKNNKVKTDWNNLNIESCHEVDEIKIEELELNDDIESL